MMASGTYYDEDGNVIGGWAADDAWMAWQECRAKLLEQTPDHGKIWNSSRDAAGKTRSWITVDGEKHPFPSWDEWQENPVCPATA
jgi:hypothetical protein